MDGGRLDAAGLFVARGSEKDKEVAAKILTAANG